MTKTGRITINLITIGRIAITSIVRITMLHSKIFEVTDEMRKTVDLSITVRVLVKNYTPGRSSFAACGARGPQRAKLTEDHQDQARNDVRTDLDRRGDGIMVVKHMMNAMTSNADGGSGARKGASLAKDVATTLMTTKSPPKVGNCKHVEPLQVKETLMMVLRFTGEPPRNEYIIDFGFNIDPTARAVNGTGDKGIELKAKGTRMVEKSAPQAMVNAKLGAAIHMKVPMMLAMNGMTTVVFTAGGRYPHYDLHMLHIKLPPTTKMPQQQRQ